MKNWKSHLRNVVLYGLWVCFVVTDVGWLFNRVSDKSFILVTLIVLLVQLAELTERMKDKPPLDIIVQMDITVDRPAKVLDVKTKLNGKEPTSGGRVGSSDATKVEEDKAKMN